MDTFLLVLHGVVVLVAIYLGVREGGVGLGIYGLLGVLVLVYGFHLAPGSPPVDAVFIIIAVITAASAMQAAGGVDWMVGVAAHAIQGRPQSVTFVAPAMAFLFTVGAGTGNIYYPLLPVIYDVSYRQGIRPERPLAVSAVASQVGILCSPVSAATAALVALYETNDMGFGLTNVLFIMWPACIVGLAVAALIQTHRGLPLQKDPVYQGRLADGQVNPVDTIELEEKALPATAKPSALIFLAGVAVIVLLGLFEELRPVVGLPGQDEARVTVTTTIQIVMGAVGALILLLPGVKGGDVAKQSTFAAGMTGAIALLGLAWLAETFVDNHNVEINNALGDVVEDYKLLFAVALFIVGALTTSQSGTTNSIVPIGINLGLSAATITAMWPAVMGMYFLPANGSQIATVAFDQTGTTRIGKYVLNHSFLVPTLIFVAVAVAVAFVISPLV